MIPFFETPLQITLYFGFVFAAISLWIRPILSVVFVLAAVLLAFFIGYLSPVGVIWLAILSLLLLSYNYYQTPIWSKSVHAVGIFLGCYLFYLHLMPGVYNPIIIEKALLAFDSWPYRSYLNIDKIFLGILLIACCTQLNRNLDEWKQSLRAIVPPYIILLLVLIPIALVTQYVRFDPKFPSILWLWVPINLLFVCLTEEALCRGFLQSTLQSWLQDMKAGNVIAIIVGALAFGGLHYGGGPGYVAFTTIAGLGYGYAYFRSGRIETAIGVHFLINLTHILLFSYPALR